MRKLWLLVLYGVLLLIPTFWKDIDWVPADATVEISEPCRYVALTFDDGPKAGTTDILLDGLRQRGASATFFVVGEQAQLFPELVQRIYREGHQLGNHTWSHVRLQGDDSKSLQEEIMKTEKLLQTLLGGEGYWLRPPYGQVEENNDLQISVPMVKWSVDPRDWESRDTGKIVQAVISNVREGSIILLHDIYPSSVEAALRLVDALQNEGYCFVTVEELLRLNGVEPRAGVLYRSGRSA